MIFSYEMGTIFQLEETVYPSLVKLFYTYMKMEEQDRIVLSLYGVHIVI